MGQKEGIHVEKTKVGDRYVLENMRKNGYNIGGEQSGHVIFLDDNTIGDGLLSAPAFIRGYGQYRKTVVRTAEIMEVLPQALVNAKFQTIKKKNSWNIRKLQMLWQMLRKIQGRGRVLIRPSGTEPLVRVMIEGKDQKVIDEEAKKLAELITKNYYRIPKCWSDYNMVIHSRHTDKKIRDWNLEGNTAWLVRK